MAVNLDNLNIKTRHLMLVAIVGGAVAGGLIDLIRWQYNYTWLICSVLTTIVAIVGECIIRYMNPPD